MRQAIFSALMIMLLTLTACKHQVLDHFKCYVAEGEVPKHEALILKDQFHIEKGVRIVELRYFCNPVTKSVGNKSHEAAPGEDHLTCYKLEPDEPFKANVNARNQFGETELKTSRSELLCVPTRKQGFEKLPPDKTEDCPGGQNCCCNMPDGAGGTWPDCDPGFECRRQVNTTNPNDAIQVCVPIGTPAGQPLQLNSSQPPFCRK